MLDVVVCAGDIRQVLIIMLFSLVVRQVGVVHHIVSAVMMSRAATRVVKRRRMLVRVNLRSGPSHCQSFKNLCRS